MNAVEQSYFNALISQIKESGFDSHRHHNNKILKILYFQYWVEV